MSCHLPYHRAWAAATRTCRSDWLLASSEGSSPVRSLPNVCSGCASTLQYVAAHFTPPANQPGVPGSGSHMPAHAPVLCQ